MKTHSVIFIDHYDQPKYERFDRKANEPGFARQLISNFHVVPWELPKRIILSFIPPILGDTSRRVYVDFVGPLIAVTLLWLMLHSGYSYKHPSAVFGTPPSLILAYYCFAMPSICMFLAKVGKSNLSLAEIIAVLGYGLYGHIMTLFVCYIFNMETSNLFFIAVMIIFGGLSGTRLVIVLLMTIPKPAARLLVCSITTIIHILFLVFIHYAYMHRTFIYGGNRTVTHL